MRLFFESLQREKGIKEKAEGGGLGAVVSLGGSTEPRFGLCTGGSGCRASNQAPNTFRKNVNHSAKFRRLQLDSGQFNQIGHKKINAGAANPVLIKRISKVTQVVDFHVLCKSLISMIISDNSGLNLLACQGCRLAF